MSTGGPRPRVRAPELAGRGWLNTGGEPLRLGDLRGRFVLLDFWTFCCVNCLHVIDELRELEAKYADDLVVVGAHSPKFFHEADPDALAQAVERYDVRHPVLDDPELVTWQAYAARAWPTLVLIDPEGYVVAQYAGEGHAHAIAALISELREVHRAKGTLQPGTSPYVAPRVEPTDLRFPAKAIRLVDNGILVADAGHGQLVDVAPDAQTVRRTIGAGDLREPNGLCLLPEELASEVGYDVVVADTAGHRLAGVELATGDVRQLAGTGDQWMQGDGTAAMSSPWDVAWWQDRIWVAMAGVHQLWTFDPATGVVEVAAGTTNEGLVDGPLAEAWFAQTSGLAADGDRLWLVDSETSALRYVEHGEVATVIGEGLFDFGFRDGERGAARLQHPLGLVVRGDGSVLVADTYNGAVRRFDPATRQLTTVASGLVEPSGLVLLDEEQVLVVESGGHRLTPIVLHRESRADGPVSRTRRPPTDIAGGEVTIEVSFTPPPGQKVDERFGPATQLQVGATPGALIGDGGGVGADLTRVVLIDPAVGEGVLHIAARAASCDIADGEGAACRMHQQDWGVPVRVVEGGERVLRLPLGGAT